MSDNLNIDSTPLEWEPLWTAMRPEPHRWVPTTEAMFYAMLEAVPPFRTCGSAFLVGEASHPDSQGRELWACFYQHGDTVEARYMTLEDWAQFKAVRA